MPKSITRDPLRSANDGETATVVDALPAVADGEQISRFKEGDRVYALAAIYLKGGFYAQYAVVKAENASLIPNQLTTEQADVMPAGGWL